MISLKTVKILLKEVIRIYLTVWIIFKLLNIWSIERRRIQQNDPEVQVRHRDLVTKLKNNYSTNAAGRSSSSITGQNLDQNEPSSSRNNQTEESPSSFKYNFLSKASIDSYKNKFSSTLPSFLTKKTTLNGWSYFCFFL